MVETGDNFSGQKIGTRGPTYKSTGGTRFILEGFSEAHGRIPTDFWMAAAQKWPGFLVTEGHGRASIKIEAGARATLTGKPWNDAALRYGAAHEG
jgi:hypothetical protein